MAANCAVGWLYQSLQVWPPSTVLIKALITGRGDVIRMFWVDPDKVIVVATRRALEHRPVLTSIIGTADHRPVAMRSRVAGIDRDATEIKSLPSQPSWLTCCHVAPLSSERYRPSMRRAGLISLFAAALLRVADSIDAAAGRRQTDATKRRRRPAVAGEVFPRDATAFQDFHTRCPAPHSAGITDSHG